MGGGVGAGVSGRLSAMIPPAREVRLRGGPSTGSGRTDSWGRGSLLRWGDGRFANRPYGPSPNSLWIPAFAGKTGGLVDGDAFGEVAGAVYGAAFGLGAVVGH